MSELCEITDEQFERVARIGELHARSNREDSIWDWDTFADNTFHEAFSEALDRFHDVIAIDLSDAVYEGINRYLHEHRASYTIELDNVDTDC